MKNRDEVIADIEDSLRSMNDYSQGLPSMLKEDVGFFVAARIVEYNDTSFLELVPQEVQEEVFDIVRVYRDQGYYEIISNVARADHTDMVSKLSTLLKTNNIF